jgi:Rrf2 family transcriptional regulator, cysteine metabolism repressor
MLLVDLAMNEAGAPVSLKSIADRQRLSEHYLEQLIAPLRNSGLVRSVRGAYGGYVLAKRAADIKVSEVILTLEGPISIVDEDLQDGLEELWERLRSAIMSVLDSLTLQDLVDMKHENGNSFMYYI